MLTTAELRGMVDPMSGPFDNAADELPPELDEHRPIVRPSLHEAIVSRVRDMITEGVLAAGMRIHEGNLGRELGVSRTPLREALKFLASEGLIELAPGRGAIVRIFTQKDVRDALVVLENIEALAGRLACENATEEQIRQVRLLHDEMIRRYAARDRLPYFKLNQLIHTTIVGLSGNKTLAYIHGMLQGRLKRIRYIGHEGPEKWAAAVADHEEIIAALETRDPDRLARALASHMTQAWERVKDSI
jgi:DNA-binding GntR family transcriptional regulator